jgi:hypothetical protein
LEKIWKVRFKRRRIEAAARGAQAAAEAAPGHGGWPAGGNTAWQSQSGYSEE